MDARLLLSCLPLLLPACRLDLTRPTPLAGPPPRSIVVAPLRDHTARPGLRTFLLAGADAALRARGCRVLPLAVGHDLLRERGLLQAGEPEPTELLAVGQELDVEAALLVEVRRFEAAGARELAEADWEIDYRLLSTGTGAELWRHTLQGHYQRPPPEPFDPMADPFAEPRPVAIGVARPAIFRDLGELVPALHRAAFDHLQLR